MTLSSFTGLSQIAENSDATPGLWNARHSIISQNLDQLNSDASNISTDLSDVSTRLSETSTRLTGWDKGSVSTSIFPSVDSTHDLWDSSNLSRFRSLELAIGSGTSEQFTLDPRGYAPDAGRWRIGLANHPGVNPNFTDEDNAVWITGYNRTQSGAKDTLDEISFGWTYERFFETGGLGVPYHEMYYQFTDSEGTGVRPIGATLKRSFESGAGSDVAVFATTDLFRVQHWSNNSALLSVNSNGLVTYRVVEIRDGHSSGFPSIAGESSVKFVTEDLTGAIKLSNNSTWFWDGGDEIRLTNSQDFNMTGGSVDLGCPNSVINPNRNNTVSIYVDESVDSLVFRVKYSTGTIFQGSISLSEV